MEEGFVLWLTQPPRAGKTTLARMVEKILTQQGFHVDVLDGDEMRRHMSKDLGFSKADWNTNVRRLAMAAGC